MESKCEEQSRGAFGGDRGRSGEALSLISCRERRRWIGTRVSREERRGGNEGRLDPFFSLQDRSDEGLTKLGAKRVG